MFSKRLKKLRPYVPGEQPRDRRYLKLNTNENPFPPSPRIGDFLKRLDVERLRLYPDPLFNRLRERIADKYGVKKENVFLSNGSDEALSFAFYAFFDVARGPVLFPEFTYTFYPVYCNFYGLEYKKIPLNRDFSVDLEAFLRAPAACGVVFANPNAPTGIGLPLGEILHLLKNLPRDRVVLIDEAYVDFGGESAVDLVQSHENLLVVRTFSKSMALAGLRLGFVIGGKGLVDALFTVKDSFNSYPVDTLSLEIGEIALDDEAYYRAITEEIIATREFFSSRLRSMGWDVFPSQANFVFAGKRGFRGEEVYLKLKERGILVRYFDIEGIRDFVRITIGRKEDMKAFLDAVGELF